MTTPASDDATVINALERAAFDLPADVLQRQAPPPVLFHFSSIPGLTGILETKTIWAPIVGSSTDAGESTYVSQVTTELVEEWGPDAPVGIKIIPFFMDPQNAPVGVRVRFHSFAASFCDTVADSSLWQLYGAEGTGAALGFSTAELAVSPFRLLEVVYDRAHQLEIVRRLIGRVLGNHIGGREEAIVDPNHRYFNITAYMAAQGILAVGHLMKAPAFRSEREWRLVATDIEMDTVLPGQQLRQVQTSIKMRAHGSRLIAYKEIPFERLQLKEVVLGAACQTDPTDYVIRRALPDIPVSRSLVKVRPR